MPIRRITRVLIAASFVACCLVVAACGGRRSEVLATYAGGRLTVADFDAHVRALPEARRVAPEGAGREAWLEELLRALAMERVLADSDAVRERLASAETAARRRWAVAGLLAAEVIQELARGAGPTDDAVREQLSAMPVRDPQPRYNFRHVFLRLDRAADAVGERQVRRQAASIRRRAAQGEDFATLARQYSQSSTATVGGLVENQRPSRLEETARQALEELAEGEISPVVESRTGLHVFKLERKLIPPSPTHDKLEAQARGILTRDAMAAERAALVATLRQRFEVAIDGFPWRVGSFEVLEADLGGALGSVGSGERQRQQLVEHLLLAEEGRRRGLLTVQLEDRVDRQLRGEAIQQAYQERLAAYVAEIPEQRLRSLYDARPAAFAEPGVAHLDLIFVPQGRDVFATQRRMEDHVADLRAGASFSELARQISTGPGVEDGGDLGLLPPSEWVRLGPEIYKAVVAMEAGVISDPVYQTDRVLNNDPRLLRGGFAILRVRDKSPPRERTFAEAIDDLRAAYARKNAAEVAQVLRTRILDQADFAIVRLPSADELLQ